ncbi:UbiA prenyltransferase family-domain-containing protein [Kockovaella imperatae]|uniref:4-hydroxybenzoate polyprenyltransferase, mitochondrial n=1 Tax=Kockovaella imperatae TaxID=4999 RepID=A0A1Y1UE32_9TREE|nr:UbiA prenyltransferase family-domain-containing protein [Kockovaella imperatae]ORX36298.1 UbiA prenyltransferase family-domain-containing protein [Kockovaella imperatae]
MISTGMLASCSRPVRATTPRLPIVLNLCPRANLASLAFRASSIPCILRPFPSRRSSSSCSSLSRSSITPPVTFQPHLHASTTRHRSSSSRSTTPSSTPSPPGVVTELAFPKVPSPPTIWDKVLPRWAAGAKPYLLISRVDKPIGWILLYWPCAWSITMASTVHHLPPTVPAFYMTLFAVGAMVMRGAGCTINDMWDQKFDKAVERTRWRPLANGDMTQFQALSFLGAQLSVGLLVLTQLNWYSIVLGASSLGLVVVYPFMKRITYYPQFVLGLAFNWGAFLGWSAVTGAVDWVVTVPMYIGGVLWCVMYDTIYAHQDKRDDILVGVKSIALRFPSDSASRTLISSLSASFVGLMTLTGHLAGLGPWYYAISCAGTALHLGWQCKTVNFDSRPDLWKKFCSNGWLGGLVWLGIAADYVSRVMVPGLY